MITIIMANRNSGSLQPALTRDSMERVFHKRALHLTKSDRLPPSIPLILSSEYDYDVPTHSLIRKEGCAGSNLHLVGVSLELLRTVDKPIAVLSICGPYRTGKSYFLSRILGSTETFKLGHGMSAFTRGVWMSTSVLECDEFAVLFIDTEGIDATDSTNSSHVTSLLVLTVLMSSMLIYNSRNVPRARDFRKLSALVNLSARVMLQESDQQLVGSFSDHLPEFLWLLRDIDTIPTDSNRSLTDYLLQLLKSNQANSQSLAGNVSKAILELFPTITCMKLPPPSTDGTVLADMFKHKEYLHADFNTELNHVACLVLQKIQPMHGYKSSVCLDGFDLASMVEQFVCSINTPGQVPVLESSWKTAVQLKLTHLADQLVKEYEDEMIMTVKPRFPMEDGLNGETGDTLMNAHLAIFAKQRLVLHKRIISYLSSCSLNKRELDSMEIVVLSHFNDQVVLYKDERQQEVKGGKLLQFIEDNYQRSLEFCSEVYITEYENLKTLVNTAIVTSEPIDISSNVKELNNRYWSLAVGPAKGTVFEEKRLVSKRKEMELTNIPGIVTNFRVSVRAFDKVKLSWDPPTTNTRVVKHYKVYCKPSGQEMFLAKTSVKCSAVVSHLENLKLHMFTICAVGDKYSGKLGPVIFTRTDMSKSAFVVSCATVGVLTGGMGFASLFAVIPNLINTMITLERESNQERLEHTREEIEKLEQQIEDKLDKSTDFQQKVIPESDDDEDRNKIE